MMICGFIQLSDADGEPVVIAIDEIAVVAPRAPAQIVTSGPLANQKVETVVRLKGGVSMGVRQDAIEVHKRIRAELAVIATAALVNLGVR